jgi:hypothetical protein
MSVRTGYVRYYECLSGGGVDQRIRVESMGGGWQCVLRPGQGFRLPSEETGGIVVTNLSGAAMAGTLKLGPRDWQFEDQRLLGEVSVIDGGRSRTLSNTAFAGQATCSAVAATFAHAQLWNPAGSGRILLVSQTIVGSSFAWFCGMSFVASALSNLTGNPQSKRSNGSASVAQLRTQNNAVLLGSTNLVALSGPVNVTNSYKLTEPFAIVPGNGLTVSITSQNTDLSASFEFVEEPA